MVYQGLPNPADETPSGVFDQSAELLPEAVTAVGTLAGNFSATQETRDKVVAVAPEFGWGFSETTLEFNTLGEADWTPFVKQLQDAGSTAVSWSGSCLPNLQLFAQTAKANGLDVPIITDANHYEAKCAEANTDGALDNLYLRMAFIPFEEADVNPATQDYLDLIADNGGDTSLLGAQATSSFLLWATAASSCGAELTRECTLEHARRTCTSWTGHGLHAEADPGGNHPPHCNILLHLEGTEYVRVAPEERGTFECKDNWVSAGHRDARDRGRQARREPHLAAVHGLVRGHQACTVRRDRLIDDAGLSRLHVLGHLPRVGLRHRGDRAWSSRTRRRVCSTSPTARSPRSARSCTGSSDSTGMCSRCSPS